MNKILLLTLMSSLSLPLLASEETWSMGASTFKLMRIQRGTLINPSCLKLKSCEALLASQKKHSPRPQGSGGKNPGSAICADDYQGKVFIAKRGPAEQAFCQFKDASILSLDGFKR